MKKWSDFMWVLALLSLWGCKEETQPKPYGQVRLEYPEAQYREFKSTCPYTFEYSTLAKKIPEDRNCSYNIYYPLLKATIYLSYDEVDKNLKKLIIDSEKSVYEPHTTQAEYIDPKIIVREKSRVFGTLYELTGQSALNFQFHLTDSTQHFLRGAVYFDAHPRPDSLAPALDYIRKDVERLMETAMWK